MLVFDENDPLPKFDHSMKIIGFHLEGDNDEKRDPHKAAKAKRKFRYQLLIYFLTYFS